MSQPTPTGPTVPGPSSYGPPPVGQPMPPAPAPERRSWFARHKILTGIGAVVVLAIIGAAIGGGGDDDETANTGTEQATTSPAAEAPAEDAPAEEAAAEEAPAAPGLNTPVEDGKFTFTVTGVETGLAQVGSEYLTTDAQGQYVLVHLTVANTGNEAQYLFASSQEATDTLGRTHAVDSTATIYAGETDTWASQINPGNQVTGTLVFDIPADATLASVTLHDSPFSGGITVQLG